MADIVIVDLKIGPFPHMASLRTAHLKCLELFLKKNPARHVTRVRTIRNCGEAACMFHEGEDKFKPYVRPGLSGRRR